MPGCIGFSIVSHYRGSLPDFVALECLPRLQPHASYRMPSRDLVSTRTSPFTGENAGVFLESLHHLLPLEHAFWAKQYLVSPVH